MDATAYRHWITVARSLTPNQHEAEEVLQDALLAAISTGRTGLASAQDQGWFAGVLRNQAAFRARTEVRRRHREQRNDPPRQSNSTSTEIREAWPSELRKLPRGLRIVLLLVVHGHSRTEIRHLLAISDTALRQRLTALRRQLASWPAIAVDAIRHVQLDTPRADIGPLRRALQLALAHRPGIGLVDPDGHPLILTSQSSTPRQQKITTTSPRNS